MNLARRSLRRGDQLTVIREIRNNFAHRRVHPVGDVEEHPDFRRHHSTAVNDVFEK